MRHYSKQYSGDNHQLLPVSYCWFLPVMCCHGDIRLVHCSPGRKVISTVTWWPRGCCCRRRKVRRVVRFRAAVKPSYSGLTTRGSERRRRTRSKSIHLNLRSLMTVSWRPLTVGMHLTTTWLISTVQRVGRWVRRRSNITRRRMLWRRRQEQTWLLVGKGTAFIHRFIWNRILKNVLYTTSSLCTNTTFI